MAGATLDRRVAALKAKLASLTTEATSWAKATEAGPLKYHASQIEDVTGGLLEMHADIAASIAKAEDTKELTLPAVEQIERRILAALSIWEFYRDKFVLRLVSDLTEPLALVDDLAWHAYRPPRDLAVKSNAVEAVDVREPPLVFPNGRWSPFARSRHTAYELDTGTGPSQVIDGFDRWIKAVPVPVVGIPWYQLTHLPDAVFIGHEVGHLVLDDFELEESLGSAIRAGLPNATSERRTAWSIRWLSETFADVYGVLTTGSAYAAVLLDLIAGDADVIAKEAQPDAERPGSPWSDYPTRALRARLVCETVRQLPVAQGGAQTLFTDRAHELESAWLGAHPGNAMPDYVPDLEAVVRAILTTPLPAFRQTPGGEAMPLARVLPFTYRMETDARQDGREANGMKPVVASDIRVLFAGVAHAFTEDPAKFAKSEAHDRFLARMKQYRTQGKRGVAVPGFNPASPVDRHRAMARAIEDAFASEV
jgi:hypothetical protein